MGQKHAREFWSERDEYHDLVEAYDAGVELVHPNAVTGRTGCGLCYHCGWCATAYVRPEYRGPRIATL